MNSNLSSDQRTDFAFAVAEERQRLYERIETLEARRVLDEQQLTAAISHLRLDEKLKRPAFEIMRELFAAGDSHG